MTLGALPEQLGEPCASRPFSCARPWAAPGSAGACGGRTALVDGDVGHQRGLHAAVKAQGLQPLALRVCPALAAGRVVVAGRRQQALHGRLRARPAQQRSPSPQTRSGASSPPRSARPPARGSRVSAPPGRGAPRPPRAPTGPPSPAGPSARPAPGTPAGRRPPLGAGSTAWPGARPAPGPPLPGLAHFCQTFAARRARPVREPLRAPSPSGTVRAGRQLGGDAARGEPRHACPPARPQPAAGRGVFGAVLPGTRPGPPTTVPAVCGPLCGGQCTCRCLPGLSGGPRAQGSCRAAARLASVVPGLLTASAGQPAT